MVESARPGYVAKNDGEDLNYRLDSSLRSRLTLATPFFSVWRCDKRSASNRFTRVAFHVKKPVTIWMGRTAARDKRTLKRRHIAILTLMNTFAFKLRVVPYISCVVLPRPKMSTCDRIHSCPQLASPECRAQKHLDLLISTKTCLQRACWM